MKFCADKVKSVRDTRKLKNDQKSQNQAHNDKQKSSNDQTSTHSRRSFKSVDNKSLNVEESNECVNISPGDCSLRELYLVLFSSVSVHFVQMHIIDRRRVIAYAMRDCVLYKLVMIFFRSSFDSNTFRISFSRWVGTSTRQTANSNNNMNMQMQKWTVGWFFRLYFRFRFHRYSVVKGPKADMRSEFFCHAFFFVAHCHDGRCFPNKCVSYANSISFKRFTLSTD